MEDSVPSSLEEVLQEYFALAEASAKIPRSKQDEIEKTIVSLGQQYVASQDANKIKQLLAQVKPLFTLLPNAKTAKIVHTLVNLVSRIPKATDLQIELCLDSIEWAKKSDRAFLRQKIEAQLATCYLHQGSYAKALKVLSPLLLELKRFDDKLLLLEVQLIESRVYHKMMNIPKSKAALTAARTSANAVYCPPLLQAQIDMQAGILHAEEKDFKTAYSYFYECFEGYNSVITNDPNVKREAMGALKYMLLCKIMLNSISEVNQIVGAKATLGYTGSEVEAMRAMADAHHQRSLEAFRVGKQQFKEELTLDPVMARHLLQLEDTLFEQNLCRIIEPFSCIEISHVAELISLPVEKVEKKLSQMILDKKFSGILDQGAGTLIVYDDSPVDQTYPAALETVQSLNKVVDSLYQKALLS